MRYDSPMQRFFAALAATALLSGCAGILPNYTLYYWAVPFRGQFVRALLAYGGEAWTEAGDEAVGALMEGALEDKPVPFMGPPVLVDHAAGVAVSQMPAILLYLGDKLGLFPDDPGGRALSIKVVNDANDVIDDLTPGWWATDVDRSPLGDLCPAPAKVDGSVGGTRPTSRADISIRFSAVSYTHLRAHET